MDRPPSTCSTCPVTQLCWGDNSQQMAYATSPGSPKRPNGCMATEALRDASFAVRKQSPDDLQADTARAASDEIQTDSSTVHDGELLITIVGGA